MTPEFIATYVILGLFAGVLAGLLGVGGGLVIVPVLAWTFTGQAFPAGHVMHLAVATSLATVVFTAISSTLAHHRRAAVEWAVVSRLAPGIVAGAVVMGWLARYLSSDVLRITFGVFACAAALNMAWDRMAMSRGPLPGPGAIAAAGAAIGALSTLVGIGGGSLTVPYLVAHGVNMRNAVGTSAACGFPIALAGALALAASGQGVPGLPAGSTGFVYWPAALVVACASMLAAPAGARLAHALPARSLKRVFALLLAIMGVRLIIGG